MHNSLPRTSAINASLPSQSSFAVDKPMRKDEKRRSWETLLIWTLPTSGPSSIVRELCGPCWSDWSCHGKATLQLPYSHSLETDALSASVWKSLHPLPPPLRAAVIAAADAGASAGAEALPAALPDAGLLQFAIDLLAISLTGCALCLCEGGVSGRPFSRKQLDAR